MASLARGVGEEAGPGRTFVLYVGFFCALVGGICVGLAIGGVAGIVPLGLPLGEDLAAAAFFLTLLVLTAVLVRRHGGRLALIGFILTAVFASFVVLASFMLFAPDAAVCVREELPLVPALRGASGLAQVVLEECVPATLLRGYSPAQAAALLSPAALVALLSALAAARRSPRLLGIAFCGAFLAVLAGLALALVRD